MAAAAMAQEAEVPLADAELVRRIRGGERALFEVLMRRYNQRLYRVARSILRSEAEAEDAMQQAWMQAWRQLGQLADGAAVSGWLARLAANEAFGRLRRQRPEELLTEAEMDQGARSPEQAAAARELVRRVEEAVERLPAGEREAFVLRDVAGLATAAAAAALGVSPGALKVRLHRAHLALRAEVGEALEVAPGAFPFPAARCNPMVARVMARIERE